MVGFWRNPVIEGELYQPPSDDPLHIDLSVSELVDFSSSFVDSLLDFDCISDWIKETPVLDMADLNPDSVKTMEVKSVEGCPGMEKDGSYRETGFGDGVQDLGNLNTSIEGNPNFRMVDLNPILEKNDSVSIEVKVGCRMEKETGFRNRVQKSGDLSFSIEKEIRKIMLAEGSEENGSASLKISGANSWKSVDGMSVSEHGAKSCQNLIFYDDGLLKRVGAVDINGSSEIVTANGDGPSSHETECDGDESNSKPDSNSSSLLAASSSSSSEEEEDGYVDDDGYGDGDEEEEKEKKEELKLEEELDMEEGEIRDSEMERNVWGSDDDEEDEDGSVAKGPIRSRNELQFLPPVPPVNVTLQPHHRTLPLGVILSIIGAQVIVEGIERHNPLSEGSILWITESRSPLGLIDEIFGPVKNPYYMIRYNSENEIPSGIKNNTPISFVPEFANHILNDSSLYKKGYDASGEHDEEVTDEAEFSDDEKEADHRRMLKMSERGTNGPNIGNKKKERKKINNGPFVPNRGGGRQLNRRPSTSQRPGAFRPPPINENHQFTLNSRPSAPQRPEAFHPPPINQNQQFTLNSRPSAPQRPEAFHNQNQQFTLNSRPSTPQRLEAFHQPQPPINQNPQFTLNSQPSTPQRPEAFHQPPINQNQQFTLNSQPSTPQRPDSFHQPPFNQNQQFALNSQPSTPQGPDLFHQPPFNQNQQFALNSQPSTPQGPDSFHQPPFNQNQQFTHDHRHSSSSFGTCQGFAGNPRLVAPFQPHGFLPPSSGVWTHGMPCEQQNMGFPFGIQTNGGMTCLQQNQQHHQSYQMPFPNGMPFQQQFNPGQMLPPNLGAQSNCSPVPAFAPCPGCSGQNGLIQPFGMVWQAQQAPMPINVGEQPRPLIPSNSEVPRVSNPGVNSGHARRPFHMGGGYFGGNGPRQSN